MLCEPILSCDHLVPNAPFPIDCASIFVLIPYYQEAVAIGRTFAAMKDYQIDGNKEMVALGTMNIVGSMTSCYIATGKHF